MHRQCIKTLTVDERKPTTESQRHSPTSPIREKFIIVYMAWYYWYANRTEHRRLCEKKTKKSTKGFGFFVSVILSIIRNRTAKRKMVKETVRVWVYDVDDDDDRLRWKNELRFWSVSFCDRMFIPVIRLSDLPEKVFGRVFLLLFFLNLFNFFLPSLLQFFYLSALSSKLYKCIHLFSTVAVLSLLDPIQFSNVSFFFSFIILLEFQSVSSCSYPYQRIGLFFISFRSFNLGTGMHNMDAHPALFIQFKRSLKKTKLRKKNIKIIMKKRLRWLKFV